MMEQIERVIFSEEQIAKRVQELGERLAEEYVDKRPLIVGILKGSIIFMADLLKAMQIPLEIDFMTISSYGNKAKSSGEVKIVKDLDRTLEGRHLIIVEDVVDSGYTLSYLTNILNGIPTKNSLPNNRQYRCHKTYHSQHSHISLHCCFFRLIPNL